MMNLFCMYSFCLAVQLDPGRANVWVRSGVYPVHSNFGTRPIQNACFPSEAAATLLSPSDEVCEKTGAKQPVAAMPIPGVVLFFGGAVSAVGRRGS